MPRAYSTGGTESRRRKRTRGGEEAVYIYFVQVRCCGCEAPIKIGTARNVARRLTSLQTASPWPLELRAVLRGTLEGERQLHQRFADARLSGEWFRATDELVAFVEAAAA